MRYLLCLLVLFLFTSLAVPQEKDVTEQTGDVKYRELVAKGEWISLIDKGNGYTLQVQKDEPAVDDAALRYSDATLDVRQAELDRAVESEKRVRGSVGKIEIQRLASELQLANANRERLRAQSHESIYQVVSNHDEYLKLKSGKRETYIPWANIYGITRIEKPATH